MSLRTKWVLVLVCLTAVASGAVGLMSYRMTAAQLETELDRSLGRAVPDAAPDPRRVPGAGRRPAPLSGLGDVEVQYLRADGTVVLAEGSPTIPVRESDLAIAASSPRGERVFRDDEIEGSAVRVVTVGLGDGRGAVQGARSTEEMDRVLASLRARILALSCAVAAVAAIAGVAIGGSITRRLLRLSAVAEQVADTGTLDAHVPAEGSDEVARLGSAFNDMLTALARSEAEQARLVQDAGHELRTPMTSLRTNLYTLRSFSQLDAVTRAQVIADLEGETEELSGLIEEVLAASAGSANDEPTSTVEVGGLVRGIAERTASRWNRALEVSAPEPLTLALREKQVGRAVRNMVDNACKFSPEGSPIEVLVRRSEAPEGVAGAGGEGVQITVLDRGPGFDESDLDAVFARFHRSVGARSMPGSGLGLSMVAAAAASHGGGVRAANRDGGGASVTLWIPLT